MYILDLIEECNHKEYIHCLRIERSIGSCDGRMYRRRSIKKMM